MSHSYEENEKVSCPTLGRNGVYLSQRSSQFGGSDFQIEYDVELTKSRAKQWVHESHIHKVGK